MKNRIGEKHITNEGYTIEIIEYFGNRDCTIQFEDTTTVENIRYGSIVRGEIKNPYHKSVLSVGYFGVGVHKMFIKGKATKTYNTWQNMLIRCHNKKYQEKFPTYIGCSVAEKWCNFQVFAEWFEENYKENYVLDKDILIKGNKIYSAETCCFVPQEINSLFVKRDNSRGKYPIGVSSYKNKFQAKIKINGKGVHLGIFDTIEQAFEGYKFAKEKYIKEKAEKWKNQITEFTYKALINYKVEITD